LPSALVQNSRILHDCEKGMPFGSKCFVTCASTHRLADGFDAQIWECGDEGELSGTMPVCEGLPCLYGLPEEVLAGRFDSDCDGMVHGETCSVSCKTGYKGVKEAFSCDGRFVSGTLPQCEPSPCPVRDVQGLSTTCDGVKFGEDCFASCAPGYENKARETSVTRWKCAMVDESIGFVGEIPQCEPKSCNLSAASANVRHNCGEELLFGQSCEVDCLDGGGRAVLTCADRLEVEGEIPQECASLLQHSLGNASDLLDLAMLEPEEVSSFAMPSTSLWQVALWAMAVITLM